jgi:hypothetical protein
VSETVKGEGSGLCSRQVERRQAGADSRHGTGWWLDARGDPELAEDVAEVEVDRPRAEEQLRRDLAVGPPFGDEAGDLDLLRGELVERVRVAPPC